MEIGYAYFFYLFTIQKHNIPRSNNYSCFCSILLVKPRRIQLNIIVAQHPNSDDLKKISEGLELHNTKFIGELASEGQFRFAVFAKDDQDTTIGGLRAVGDWDWLNIEVIWVDEAVRGTGVGAQLLKKAEAYAMENNFFRISLETGSFQAREFYEKQGYEIFGQLEDYPIGHTMYYMKKVLVDKA